MDTETSRSRRHVPPAHYMMKVESYSLLSESEGKYDSPYFEAGGYKWRLSFYPNGDESFNTDNYISLYLTICETEILPTNWEVTVNFTLFVYNHLDDDYLTVQATRCFHDKKKEWGFKQLVSIKTFKDLSKGYLLDGSCKFGAEVFVINPTLNSVSLSVFGRKGISNPTFRWEIKEFSMIDTSFLNSEEFSCGGAKWSLLIYPKGDNHKKGKAFSMFLHCANGGIPSNKSTIYADFRLRVIDQVNFKHEEGSARNWFSPAGCGYGYPEMMLLEDLHKPSNGYVVDDTLIVEVEFFIMSRTKVFESVMRSKLCLDILQC